jgi:hypothetical protein
MKAIIGWFKTRKQDEVEYIRRLMTVASRSIVRVL